MIQQSNALSGNTLNQVNILSTSQAKETQDSSQIQQEDIISQNITVPPAYSLEISEEGAALNSQNSRSSTSDTAQTASALVNSAQITSKPIQEVNSQPNDHSSAYSVEISQAGAELNAATSSSTDVTDSTKISTPTNVAKISRDSDSDSSDSTSTENLSQYSDSELKQMLSEGKISQSEYDTEVAIRKAKKETDESSAANANVMGNSDVSKSA